MNKGENSKNQWGESILPIKENKRYAAGHPAVFQSAHKKKRINFIFIAVKIKADFSNREGEEKSAGKSNWSDNKKVGRPMHKKVSAACRYGVKYNKVTEIYYCFFIWFNDFIPCFFYG